MTFSILKMSTRLLLAICCLLWQCDKRENLIWQQGNGFRYAELPNPPGNQVGFKKLKAGRTGITFVNSLKKEQIINNQHLLDGSGVAAGDMDNDGLCDIYFCRLNGSNILYHNIGNWKFEDITAAAGVGLPDRFSKGAVFADLDGDNDLDLLVSVLDGPNACFVNDGSGKFSEMADKVGLSSLADRTGNTTMALADIDNDGDLDLYIVCYRFKARRDRDIPIFNEEGMILYEPDYGERDILYLNDGKGNFSDVPLDSDVFRKEDGIPVMMPRAWGLTARLQDMDGDSDPDIYVCNDFASPDIMWMNDGNGKFQAISRPAIRTTSMSSMTIDFSDIDRDGDLDFFIADMMSRDNQKRKMQQGADPRAQITVGEIYNRPQIVRNTVFLNRGDNTYAEIANFAGLEASEWTWSAIFMDADLDGYEDLLVTNGHAYDVLDYDTQYKIIQQKVRDFDELRRTIFLYPRLETHNFLFQNCGDLTFKEVGKKWGFAERGISHGLALADLDNDGDLDVVTNNFESPAGIYRNDSQAPRVAVRLQGLAPNTRGIGAKITLSGGPVLQTKEIICGGQYLSGSEPLAVFAAAGKSEQLNVEVIWRDGKRSLLQNVKADHLYEVEESSANYFQPTSQTVKQVYFKDQSILLSHTHYDEPFNDFYRQPLLPKQFSQLGPGVCWFDIDQDQDDDLLIGSGGGGQLAIFENIDKMGFRKWKSDLLNKTSIQDQSTILAFNNPFGVTSILVGTSFYEASAWKDSAILNYAFSKNHLMKIEEIPSDIPFAGPMALSDYDNDGDLDLFVGGRIIPGRYPQPTSSRLYQQLNGHFVIDSMNSAVLDEVGLISGALFSDIDDDGDSDLILAVEWGPVKLYGNNQGRFEDFTEDWGLNGFHGWWNGITTADMDENGKLDIIATNWGLNTAYRCSPQYPLKIYSGDFDNNGTYDILEAFFDPALRQYVPERGFEFMSKALPFIRSRITTFKQYGKSSLSEIVGPNLKKADSLWANTLSHMIFLNHGNTFVAIELPAEAQFAPAFYAGAADFDGDGHEDIFLSQNFFAVQPEMPRMDAGRGLWLKGDGTGQLFPVPGQESGIRVYGEQRGAALSDYDKDGRIDLVVSQNGAETKLYQNIAGQPGLRVRLAGAKGNASAVGATVQLIFPNSRSPVKEIHAGSGYWSQDSQVLIFGLPETPTSIRIKWPGGKITESEIPPTLKEIVVDMEGLIIDQAK
jgi:hypothetical protein